MTGLDNRHNYNGKGFIKVKKLTAEYQVYCSIIQLSVIVYPSYSSGDWKLKR